MLGCSEHRKRWAFISFQDVRVELFDIKPEGYATLMIEKYKNKDIRYMGTQAPGHGEKCPMVNRQGIGTVKVSGVSKCKRHQMETGSLRLDRPLVAGGRTCDTSTQNRYPS